MFGYSAAASDVRTIPESPPLLRSRNGTLTKCVAFGNCLRENACRNCGKVRLAVETASINAGSSSHRCVNNGWSGKASFIFSPDIISAQMLEVPGASGKTTAAQRVIKCATSSASSVEPLDRLHATPLRCHAEYRETRRQTSDVFVVGHAYFAIVFPARDMESLRSQTQAPVPSRLKRRLLRKGR